jgi:hypothetical protein
MPPEEISMQEDEQYRRAREVLRQLGIAIENFAIENEVYLAKLIDAGLATSETLQKEVVDRQSDPSVRKRIHKDFAAMWKALDQCDSDALLECLLRNLPPSGTVH